MGVGGRQEVSEAVCCCPGGTTTPIKLQALRLAVCQVKPFFSCGWGGEGEVRVRGMGMAVVGGAVCT